jgi:hypothetical protein
VKKLSLIFLFIPVIVVGISACQEDAVESPIIVFLTPNTTTIEANANERVLITVEASTNIGSELNMKVETIDEVFGVVQFFDSTFNQSSINYTLDYVVPQYPDSTESLIKFTFTNSPKDQIQIARRLLINKGESLVTETSGHVIYSSASDRPNAFSLTTVSPGYLQDSATFSADIVDDTSNLNNNETLSRKWVSYTEISFVEFNGFNYSSANSLTIKSAYESGIKLSRITGIQSNDIYIVGRGSKALGVIQVVAVNDQSANQDDSYNFNLKLIDK